MTKTITVLCLFASLLLGGCSTLSDILPASLGGSEAVDDNSGDQERVLPPPVELTVVDEAVKDGVLVVKANLLSKAYIRKDQLVLQAVALSDGKVLAESEHRIAGARLEPFLVPKKVVPLEFTFDYENLSEYQLKCIWGEQKQQSIDDSSSFGLSNVATEKVGQECNNGECLDLLSISALLVNLSDRPVTDIELAMGVYWQGIKGKAQIPRDFEVLRSGEKVISLNGYAQGAPASESSEDTESGTMGSGAMGSDTSGQVATGGAGFTLGAQKERSIVIRLTKALPKTKGGMLVPYLRVLSIKWK